MYSLLSLVSEFAGAFVDLLISSFQWNREERLKLQRLRKQLLETLDDTIYYLLLCHPSLSLHRAILRQWHRLIVDLEAYDLTLRIAEFAMAIECAPVWNASQRLALAVRLNAFKGSVLKTNSGNLKRLAARKNGKKKQKVAKKMRSAKNTKRSPKPSSKR